MVSHGNLAHNLQTIIRSLYAKDDTVVVSWLPQYHDMGLIGSHLGALYCGGAGVYMSPISFIKNPPMWLGAMSKYRCTHAQAPNFAYALVVRKMKSQRKIKVDNLNLHSVRHVFNAVRVPCPSSSGGVVGLSIVPCQAKAPSLHATCGVDAVFTPSCVAVACSNKTGRAH